MPWIYHEDVGNWCPHLSTDKAGRCHYCLETVYEFVSDSPLVTYMKERDIPVTRESYLNVAYLGNPPAGLGPELEGEMPSEFHTEEDDDA
jgi:hypothetical protein